MRKGSRSSTNVNLLRWAKNYDLDVTWNLIYGFPNETLDDYRAQTALIPRLVHLQPPGASGRIWMERFSPIFSDRSTFPARHVAPEGGLQHIYPKGVDLEQLAYFFDYELENALPDSAFDELQKEVTAWQETATRAMPPTLTLHRSADFVQIRDGRDADTVGIHTFSGALADLYSAVMEKPLTPRMVVESATIPHPSDEIEEALSEFVNRGLMMRDGNLFLALALPAKSLR
jgi:hypothetical protein